MAESVLRVDGIQKSFGGLRAVNNVSFEANRGELLGLIGPNGAGKTTIFNMVSGIYRTDRGRIFFYGTDITNCHPTRIARWGVARTFQVPRTFNNMTVEDNIRVAMLQVNIVDAEAARQVGAILDEVGLYEKRHQNASELSGGERQLLQFVRAAVTRPKLMMLDEPFAGSSPGAIDSMVERTIALARSGVTCLVISHDIVSLPRVCERVVVLLDGAVLTHGTLDDVREDPKVIEAYLGE